MKETMHELVTNQLVALGWAALKEPAVAKIHYRTAVRDEEALTYLSDWGGSSENWTLSGQYYSEGNNVLSTSSVFIPKDATVEQVKALVTKFDAEVTAAVNESYARRLWLRFPEGWPARAAQPTFASLRV
ncbi:hypothetical protein AB4Y45_32990 [Paraburkholderia sp. EG287A]|uniref:hypothetical protein n=1 Tax=Paraburkholderia sp. EG287A TaxID=3237012 RepID=UPI0034D31DEC